MKLGKRKKFRLEWIATAATAVILLSTTGQCAAHAQNGPQWTGSWASAQQSVCEKDGLPKRSFQGATLRETVRLSLGGSAVRLKVSNLFGEQPLVISSIAVAHGKPGDPGAIDSKSSISARFNGAAAVTVPAGAEVTSDEIPLAVEPLSDLAVSLIVASVPKCVTSHPGARATSFLAADDHLSQESLTEGESFTRWYFLSEVDVAGESSGAVTAFGDSITDGHGATTDGNDRWPDVLATRLAPQKMAILNAGIGGNRILADGLGPSAVSRFERDALGHPGVRTVILLEGINDLGMLDRDAEHPQIDHDALVNRLQAAMKNMVEEAHQKGVCLFGGTVMPFVGSAYYHPGPRSEGDREKLNAWIRTSGVFDGVIDFDKMMSDSLQPDKLAADADSGDHLHPGPEGYRRMGDGVPLNPLITKVCSRAKP
jgi:lysophospholipase L1-like esterase